MPLSRICTVLAGVLLCACTQKPSEFAYSTGGEAKPAGAAPAPATAAAPAGLPPSGDAEQLRSPAFYMPSEAELTTTPSGLKYLVIREGSGAKPTRASQFTAHYCGWLTSGEKFDSSYDKGTPLNYPVTRMVKGWTEGLQLMSPGAEYLFVVPPDLGYGAGGMPPVIPPNATLVFRLELLSFSG